MCRELLLAELGPPFVIAFGVPTLQWGRDQSIAELSSNSSDQKQSMNLLQWGREQSFAETAPRAAVAGCAARGVLTVWTDDPPPLTQRVSHVIQVYGLFIESCRTLVARPYWIIRGTTQGAPASENPVRVLLGYSVEPEFCASSSRMDGRTGIRLSMSDFVPIPTILSCCPEDEGLDPAVW
jgi:hypothetical protein